MYWRRVFRSICQLVKKVRISHLFSVFLLAEYNSTDVSEIFVLEKSEANEDVVFPFMTEMPSDGSSDISDFINGQISQMKEKRTNAAPPAGDEDVLFSYINNDASDPAFSAYIAAEQEASRSETVPDSKMNSGQSETTPGFSFKMMLEVQWRGDGQYRAALCFRKDLYSRELADGLLRAFVHVAKQFASANVFAGISLLDEKEEALLDELNRTEVEYDASGTVIDRFRKIARSLPEKTAIITPEKELSYQQVDVLTDRIAGHLQKEGFRKGQIAGVLVPRNEYMLLSSLAVLKAAGAYLPLDASYPSERLSYMLQDANATILLTTKDLAGIIWDTKSSILTPLS